MDAWRGLCGLRVILAAAIVVTSMPAAWPQWSTTPLTKSGPSQVVLGYVEVVKGDLSTVEQYAHAVEAEIRSLAPIFESLRERTDRSIAQTDPDIDTSRLSWLKGDWSRFDDLAGLTVLRGVSTKFAGARAGITSVLDYHNYSEHNAIGYLDGVEHSLAYNLDFAIGHLWQTYLWEATWELRMLDADMEAKTSSIDKAHNGEVSAINQALIDDYDQIGCLSLTSREDCANRVLAAEREADRKLGGVCWRINEEVAYYLPSVAERMQSIAKRLAETHTRILGDFRRAVDQIEKDRSGAKSEIYASIDRFVERSKVIPTESFNTGFGTFNESIRMRIPSVSTLRVEDRTPAPMRVSNSTHVDLLRPCSAWLEQMPDDINAHFPAVGIEYSTNDSAWGAVGLTLNFNETQVAQGEAEGRSSDQQP